MLLQSRVEFGEENEIGIENSLSEILILPALPDAWPEGSVSGLKARGGFEVDISWKDGRLKCVKVKSRSGIKCKVRYGLKSVELGLLPGECSILDGSLR